MSSLTDALSQLPAKFDDLKEAFRVLDNMSKTMSSIMVTDHENDSYKLMVNRIVFVACSAIIITGFAIIKWKLHQKIHCCRRKA